MQLFLLRRGMRRHSDSPFDIVAAIPLIYWELTSDGTKTPAKTVSAVTKPAVRRLERRPHLNVLEIELVAQHDSMFGPLRRVGIPYCPSHVVFTATSIFTNSR